MFHQKLDEQTMRENAGMVGSVKDYKFFGKIEFVAPNPSLILFLYLPTQKFIGRVENVIESK